MKAKTWHVLAGSLHGTPRKLDDANAEEALSNRWERGLRHDSWRFLQASGHCKQIFSQLTSNDNGKTGQFTLLCIESR